MKIESPAFKNEGDMPTKYTCDGDNISPALKIINVPKDAKSLVLIMDDPDAPMGVWNHWLLWNIEPQTVEIEEGKVPKGAVEGVNTSEDNSYYGPCPPSGLHRYFFKIYALDTKLDLPPESKKEAVEEAMTNHILDQSELIGKYSRY